VKTFLKILLIPVGLVAGLFLYGFFGAMLGFYEPPPNAVQNSTVDSDHDVTVSAQREASASDEASVSPSPALPATLTARAVMAYLDQSRLVFLEEGRISLSETGFAQLQVEDAVLIYKALADHEPAKDFETARLLFFSGCAKLPNNAREDFLRETGGVFQKDSFLDDPEWGDIFSLMFALGSDELSAELRPHYARGIQNFIAVMDESEIISVLKGMDIIQSYTTATKADEWRVRTEKRLHNFDASTLVAIFEKIGTKGRNRQRLRDALQYQIDRVQSNGTGN